MVDQFVLLGVLLILSGFFSSAETALFSISTVRARHMAKDGRPSSALILRMKESPHRLLSTILIGNNLVNVGGSAIATSIAMDWFSNNAVGIATGIMTFMILVFGEIIPKSVATRNNRKIARLVIHPIHWCSIAFFPLILVLDFIPLLTGRVKPPPTITEEELITIVEVGEEEGEIREEEKELIRNIFEFDDIAASEIMIPRPDMFVMDADEPPDLKTILAAGYSRLPMIEGTIDNVVGIIHVGDLFRFQTEHGRLPDLREVMRKPYFIPENKKINTVLTQFKKRKQHMAIIIDEHGGVSGLVTLEDVLEEIVGEIADETDHVEDLIKEAGPAEWVILGKADIDTLNDFLPEPIAESPDYDTISGYLLSRIGRMPVETDSFSLDGYDMTVETMDGNRIVALRVRYHPPEEASVLS